MNVPARRLEERVEGAPDRREPVVVQEPPGHATMRSLIVVTCLVIVLAAISAASGIVVPFLLATLLAIAFQPVGDWLGRRGLPASIGALLTILGVLALVAAAGLMIWSAGIDLADSLPVYQAKLAGLRKAASGWLRAKGMRDTALTVSKLDATKPAEQALASSVLGASSFLQLLFLVLIITAFIQLEASTYRAKLAGVFGSQRPFRRAVEALSTVQRYLRVQVLLAVANGLLLGVWCWVWGLSNPLLWGVLAFALNFVPVIGSIVAAVPPVLLGFVDHGTTTGLAILGGYLAVNIVVDNILSPRILGHALGVSPLVVLLAMMVWGFVLGPVGALLAVPLTMVVKVALEYSPDLRWIALLLGEGAPSSVPKPLETASGAPYVPTPSSSTPPPSDPPSPQG